MEVRLAMKDYEKELKENILIKYFHCDHQSGNVITESEYQELPDEEKKNFVKDIETQEQESTTYSKKHLADLKQNHEKFLEVLAMKTYEKQMEALNALQTIKNILFFFLVLVIFAAVIWIFTLMNTM